MKILTSIVLTFIITTSIIAQPTQEDVYKARAEFRKGVQKGVEHDFQGALLHFNEAIKFNPIYAEAFLYRGLAFNETGEFDAAAKDFTICIELDPKFSDQAHFFRGVAKVGLGNYNGAIQDYTTAIQLNPDFIAFFRRGQANMFLEEYARALQDFEIALRLNPALSEGYLYRGMALYHLGLHPEALKDLRRASTDMKSNADAYYYTALARIEVKDYYAAVLDLDKAIELNPNLTQAYSARAKAYTGIGNNAKAREDNEKAKTLAQQEGEIIITHQETSITKKDDVFTDEEKSLPDFASLFRSREKTEAEADKKAEETKVIELSKVSEPVIPPSEPLKQEQEKNEKADTMPISDIKTEEIVPVSPNLDNSESGFYNKKLNKISPKGFGVQIASYTNTDNLLSLASAYESQFNTNVIIQISIINGRRIYRMMAGEFSDRVSAEQFRDELRSGDFPDCFLVVYDRMN